MFGIVYKGKRNLGPQNSLLTKDFRRSKPGNTPKGINQFTILQNISVSVVVQSLRIHGWNKAERRSWDQQTKQLDPRQGPGFLLPLETLNGEYQKLLSIIFNFYLLQGDLISTSGWQPDKRNLGTRTQEQFENVHEVGGASSLQPVKQKVFLLILQCENRTGKPFSCSIGHYLTFVNCLTIPMLRSENIYG